MHKFNNAFRGFTLVEIMLSLSILASLLALMFTFITQASDKRRVLMSVQQVSELVIRVADHWQPSRVVVPSGTALPAMRERRCG